MRNLWFLVISANVVAILISSQNTIQIYINVYKTFLRYFRTYFYLETLFAIATSEGKPNMEIIS